MSVPPFFRSRRLVLQPAPDVAPTVDDVLDVVDPSRAGTASVDFYIARSADHGNVPAELDEVEALAWIDPTLRPRLATWLNLDLDGSQPVADVRASLLATGLFAMVYEQPLLVPMPTGRASPPGRSRRLAAMIDEATLGSMREHRKRANMSVVEGGWDAHAALSGTISSPPGPWRNFRQLSSHGTSTLSVLCAKDVKGRKRGLLPGIGRIDMYGGLGAGGDSRVAQALAAVLRRMRHRTREEIAALGHVVLVEMQSQFVARIGDADEHTWALAPIEVEPGVRRVVDALTELGVTVVLPAGNGGVDLDGRAADGTRLLGPPSKAILVGAAQETLDGRHARLAASNHGSRVHVWAWGTGVPAACEHLHAPTLDWVDRATRHYTHTSAAAALVAGLAAGIQATRCGQQAAPLAPEVLRRVLAGNPQQVPGMERMVDPAAAFAEGIALP